MKRVLTYTIVVLLSMFLLGFQQEGRMTQGEIIAKGVEIKLQDFKSRQLGICRDKAVKLAITRVDSLIRVRAREQSVDTIVKPPKPERPEKPEIKLLPDSLDYDSLRSKQ